VEVKNVKFVIQYVIVGSTFKLYSGPNTFHINHRFDCNSEGVVYLVNCKAVQFLQL
jgi:hypothetical protein